jgi:hypothetical protein
VAGEPAEEIEFLPLVKAYPALSKTYGEVSCIAGVQMSGPAAPRWIRLYPVPFRALESDQRFSKYQPTRVRVQRHNGDTRPETRRPDRDSIQPFGKPLSTAKGWQQRRRFVEPLMVESMCELLRRQRDDKTSLGVFRPGRVEDVIIEPADVSAERAQIAAAWAAQGSLLDQVEGAERAHQVKALTLIPWRFKYRYFCSDPACRNGHRQSIIDWEIVRTYMHVKGRGDWKQRLRKRWLDDLCAADRDTAFFVGNQHLHPRSFMVLGVWWPERVPEQLGLL